MLSGGDKCYDENRVGECGCDWLGSGVICVRMLWDSLYGKVRLDWRLEGKEEGSYANIWGDGIQDRRHCIYRDLKVETGLVYSMNCRDSGAEHDEGSGVIRWSCRVGLWEGSGICPKHYGEHIPRCKLARTLGLSKARMKSGVGGVQHLTSHLHL